MKFECHGFQIIRIDRKKFEGSGTSSNFPALMKRVIFGHFSRYRAKGQNRLQPCFLCQRFCGVATKVNHLQDFRPSLLNVRSIYSYSVHLLQRSLTDLNCLLSLSQPHKTKVGQLLCRNLIYPIPPKHNAGGEVCYRFSYFTLFLRRQRDQIQSNEMANQFMTFYQIG